MFCPNCGNENRDGIKFCPRCGSQLDTQNDATVIAQPVKPQVEWAPHAAPVQGASAPQHAQDISQAPGQQPEYVPQQNYTFQPTSVNRPRKERPAPSGGTKTLTAILCIFFVIFFLLTSVLGGIRAAVDEDVIETVIDDIDLNDLSLEAADGDSIVLAEEIHYMLDDELQPYMTVREIERILDNNKTKAFLEEVAEDYLDFLLEGNRLKALDADRIVDFLRRNESTLLDDVLYEWCWRGDHYEYEFYDALHHSFDNSENLESITSKEINKALGGNLKLVQFSLSGASYVILLVLSILMLVLILVVNHSNVFACIGKILVTFLITGILLLLLAIAALIFTVALPELVQAVASPFLFVFAGFFGLCGGIPFAVGLVGLIARRHIRNRSAYEV